MNYPYNYLKALPDFSAFQFGDIGENDILLRQLRFIPSKKKDIVELALNDLREGTIQPSQITDQSDLAHIQATIIQVVELYTEKYPMKTVRFHGGTREITQLFRSAITNYLEKLLPMFEIRPERPSFFSFGHGHPTAFLLKRKMDWYFAVHTISTTLCSRSQLFGRNVHVELSKQIEISMVSDEK